MNGEKLTFTLEEYSVESKAEHPATNSFDGETSTYWQIEGSGNAYLIVKSESLIRLTGFRIYPHTTSRYVSSFNLAISEDGVDFKDVYSGECSKVASWLEYEFESALVGNYIKITFNGVSDVRMFVYDFELYGEPVSEEPTEEVFYKISGARLTDIAEAIRGKTGKADPLTLEQMATEIEGIEAGGSAPMAQVLITDIPANHIVVECKLDYLTDFKEEIE